MGLEYWEQRCGLISLQNTQQVLLGIFCCASNICIISTQTKSESWESLLSRRHPGNNPRPGGPAVIKVCKGYHTRGFQVYTSLASPTRTLLVPLLHHNKLFLTVCSSINDYNLIQIENGDKLTRLTTDISNSWFEDEKKWLQDEVCIVLYCCRCGVAVSPVCIGVVTIVSRLKRQSRKERKYLS